jgi:hypothetical protein
VDNHAVLILRPGFLSVDAAMLEIGGPKAKQVQLTALS